MTIHLNRDVRELDGIEWCLTHESAWDDGCTCCIRSFYEHPDDDECVPTPLYVGHEK